MDYLESLKVLASPARRKRCHGQYITELMGETDEKQAAACPCFECPHRKNCAVECKEYGQYVQHGSKTSQELYKLRSKRAYNAKKRRALEKMSGINNKKC